MVVIARRAEADSARRTATTRRKFSWRESFATRPTPCSEPIGNRDEGNERTKGKVETHDESQTELFAQKSSRHVPLHLVDEHGEIHEECPGCVEWSRTYGELERKYRGALSQIGNLRADKEAEARAHDLWGKAVAVFWEWKTATGHMNSQWSADRFWLCHPYLRDDGLALCRAAVWGVAAHPNMRRVTKDYTEVYDDFELAFRNRATFERYANRGRAIFGTDFPQPAPGGDDG